MGLNATPSGERITIGFFGMRNAGKSSVVNALTGQTVSVVSDTPGTTTDPVKKAMELLPLGPVVIIDTPGFDDEGDLGALRVKATQRTLAYVDIAVLVIDAHKGLSPLDTALINEFNSRSIPFIKVYNKCDDACLCPPDGLCASAKNNTGIHELKEKLGQILKSDTEKKRIVSDILPQGATCILVMPIDESAPKGRLILPQQQTIRDLLDSNMTCACCQPEQLTDVINALSKKPDLVITDSQAFKYVSSVLPPDVMLTSFSILFARYKGQLQALVNGAFAISALNDGDTVLISEGCTHHRTCNDIGSVKIPNMLSKFTGKQLNFKFTSGGEFPDTLEGISLVLHCGGCMLNEKEMTYRIRTAQAWNVPIVNYGVAIAEMNGILRRSLEIFSNLTL